MLVGANGAGEGSSPIRTLRVVKVAALVPLGLSGQSRCSGDLIHQQRVLQALTYMRRGMEKEIPEVFSGTVEVDETYQGGQGKNKQLPIVTFRGQGTRKTPVLRILCRTRPDKTRHQFFAQVRVSTV